jgi:DNA-binding MltR family transcriptional regulator
MKKSCATIIRADAKHLEHITRSLHELNAQSDRSAAIVATAILDLSLTETLTVFLHKNKQITKNFFAIGGPVGDLGPKINLAFLTGLIGEFTWRDLVTVKDIRNKFAHRLDVSDFNSRSIASLSCKLKIAEIRTFDTDDGKVFPRGCWMSVENRKEVLANPRERFLLTIHVLCYGLSIVGRTAMPPPIF